MIENFKISLVIPAYNEEKNLPVLLKTLKDILETYSQYEILIINDGSTDETLDVIRQASKNDQHIKYISFIKNYGQPIALRAGLEHITGDCAISLDADMQHPPEMIPEMIKLWQQGYDIVYTIRKKNPNVSYFKTLTSSFFYFISCFFSGSKIPNGAADFRLMDKSVITALQKYGERDLFLRGVVFQLGYKIAPLPYIANKRLFGKTHYTFKKMFNLALSGIFSLTTKPLMIISIIGFICFFISCLFLIYIMISSFFSDKIFGSPMGLVSIILFIGAMQFLFMGILGQYMSVMFLEIKKRPIYLIAEQNIMGVQNEFTQPS